MFPNSLPTAWKEFCFPQCSKTHCQQLEKNFAFPGVPKLTANCLKRILLPPTFPNSLPTAWKELCFPRCSPKSKKDSKESSEKGCWLHVPTYNSHNTMWIQKRRCYWPTWYSIFCCAHQSISAKALWELGGRPCGIVSLWQPEPVVSCISVGDKEVGDMGDKEVEVAGIEEVGDTSRILHAEEMQEAVLLQKTKHENCQQFCTSSFLASNNQ